MITQRRVVETDPERETWTLSSVAEVSLYDNPSSITDLTLSTGETAGALDVAFTAPDDGAGSYVTSYEYLVGSELPEVLPGCDERIANTWLTPQAPGLAEVHPLQNLSPETEMLVAVRSLRVANGFTFCSDWAVAMPEADWMCRTASDLRPRLRLLGRRWSNRNRLSLQRPG